MTGASAVQSIASMPLISKVKHQIQRRHS